MSKKTTLELDNELITEVYRALQKHTLSDPSNHIAIGLSIVLGIIIDMADQSNITFPPLILGALVSISKISENEAKSISGDLEDVVGKAINSLLFKIKPKEETVDIDPKLAWMLNKKPGSA